MKANYYTIGVNTNVELNDCMAAIRPENQVHSIATWAQRAGKKTGIVTTTRVTNASPAGTYAHTAHRDFESNADIENMADDPTGCRDIAKQLIMDEPGRNFDVIFGGGRRKFLPAEQYDEDGVRGNRTDGLDLIRMWQKKHRDGHYITNRKQLKHLNMHKVERVLGLFDADHMEYNLDNVDRKQPSIKEMTEAAISLLSKSNDGYFLFVEGGRIDQAHHEAKAMKALDETVQFSEAIQAAVDATSRDDTLIIVTADHAHTMSISGYSSRGNNIVGVGDDVSDIGALFESIILRLQYFNIIDLYTDKLPYLTLSYANGPGAPRNGRPRSDPRLTPIGMAIKLR